MFYIHSIWHFLLPHFAFPALRFLISCFQISLFLLSDFLFPAFRLYISCMALRTFLLSMSESFQPVFLYERVFWATFFWRLKLASKIPEQILQTQEVKITLVNFNSFLWRAMDALAGFSSHRGRQQKAQAYERERFKGNNQKTKLAALLLEKWLWGTLSATVLREIAAAASDDLMLIFGESIEEWNILANLGSTLARNLMLVFQLNQHFYFACL